MSFGGARSVMLKIRCPLLISTALSQILTDTSVLLRLPAKVLANPYVYHETVPTHTTYLSPMHDLAMELQKPSKALTWCAS